MLTPNRTKELLWDAILSFPDEPLTKTIARFDMTMEEYDELATWKRDTYYLNLWHELADVPFEEDENGALILVKPWRNFERGTPRINIWRWFDTGYSKGVASLLGL